MNNYYNGPGWQQPMINRQQPNSFSMNNFLPHYELLKVRGEESVRNFKMAPNSETILVDETAPLVWYVQTDSIQLYSNGVALPQAQSSFTGVVDAVGNFSFKTLLQVTGNNCQCNCVSSPTVLQIGNGDTALSDAHINIVVTKIR